MNATASAGNVTVTGVERLRPITLSVVGIGLDLLKVRLNLDKSEAFPLGRFHPMVSVGPAIFMATMTDTNNFSPPNQKVDQTSLGVKTGGGMELLFTQTVGIMAEYKFTRFKFDNNGSSTTISTDINTHHLTGGVVLHF